MATPKMPSDAYAAFRNTISPPALTASTTTTLLTLSIPAAGNYVIFSKLQLDDAIAGQRTQTRAPSRQGATRTRRS